MSDIIQLAERVAALEKQTDSDWLNRRVERHHDRLTALEEWRDNVDYALLPDKPAELHCDFCPPDGGQCDDCERLQPAEPPYGSREWAMEQKVDVIHASGTVIRYHDTEINWTVLPHYGWSIYEEPLTDDSIDWSHVDKRVKVIARDENLRVYGYSGSISADEDGDCWVLNDRDLEMWAIDCFASYRPGTCDWTDSKLERPGAGE